MSADILDDEIDLIELIKSIRKRWLLIVAITLTSMLIASIVSYFLIKPTYKADISVLIGSTSSSGEGDVQNYNDTLMYQKVVQTYTEIAKGRLVAEDVIYSLDLDIFVNALIDMISVARVNDTEILSISVEAYDASLARNIANQYAKSLKKIGYNIRGVDNINFLDEAELPTSPYSPRPLRNIAIASLIGMMVAIGIVIIKDLLDNKVKSQEDIENIFNLPVIGAIPLVEEDKRRRK